MSKQKNKEILCVEIFEAKENKMFTEEQRRMIRFLRYSQFIPCEECGKKRKVMWTMLCDFEAHSMGDITSRDSGIVHPPLTPVCQDHPIGPHFPANTPPSVKRK